MKMKKILIVASIVIVVVGISGYAMADSSAPPPDSGDCIPDGSGNDLPSGPNSEGSNYGPGPAPNSGDGIPDGPGWE